MQVRDPTLALGLPQHEASSSFKSLNSTVLLVPPWQWQLACAGLLITYTIMLGDVLVGKPPDYNGLLTNLTDIHDGDVWYLDRRFVVSEGSSRLLHSSDLCFASHCCKQGWVAVMLHRAWPALESATLLC